VLRSFRDEGYATNVDGETLAHPIAGQGTLSDLRRRATKVGSPLAASELFQHAGDVVVRAAAAERWFAPFVVLGAEIPCYLVPIQHRWASELLDVGLAQDQLFPRPWGLGLRRELVYYRSPRNTAGLAPPARLLWYVSGKGRGAGTIRAVSHLTEVAVDDHRRLASRFKALGVYTSQQVAERADRHGRTMALRFSHTRSLAKPVTLDDYREILTGDPKSAPCCVPPDA
jgi:predicted transcriptional regulator